MKRIKLILAAVLILIPCFVITGCGESSETNEKYGIICTSDDKLETIKDIMEVQDKKEVSGQTYYLGRIEDKNVAVVRCGSGKVNAALATQILIDKFGATRLIEVENAYTCDDNVKAGDVVVAVDTLQFDVDATQEGYALGEVPLSGVLAFATDVDLHDKTLTAAKSSIQSGNVVEGRVCSGDKYGLSDSEKKDIFKTFEGCCVDNSGAAVGEVCYYSGTPYIIISEITEGNDGTDIAAKIVKRVIKE